jgi:hypothetical protein
MLGNWETHDHQTGHGAATVTRLSSGKGPGARCFIFSILCAICLLAKGTAPPTICLDSGYTIYTIRIAFKQ